MAELLFQVAEDGFPKIMYCLELISITIDFPYRPPKHFQWGSRDYIGWLKKNQVIRQDIFYPAGMYCSVVLLKDTVISTQARAYSQKGCSL